MNIEKAYQILFSVVLLWFALLISAMLIRSIMGPAVTDRILSINMIGTMVISCIAIMAVMLGEAYLIDVALIYAMISFVSVLIMASVYIPSKTRRGKFARQEQAEVEQEKAYLSRTRRKVLEEIGNDVSGGRGDGL